MIKTEDTRTYAMLAKPISGTCNLRCTYCYYAGKETLLHTGTARMGEETLEAYIRQSLAMHGDRARVEFAWHGGEPTLAGLTFYEKAVCLERRYGEGRQIVNTLQTNATLLTDDFCRFFKDNDFLIGVSIDGPEELHNAYRKTADGAGSFSAVLKGMELLKKHGVPFNTLTTVNRKNEGYPEKVYEFLREWTDWMQFLPVVESMPAEYERGTDVCFAAGDLRDTDQTSGYAFFGFSERVWTVYVYCIRAVEKKGCRAQARTAHRRKPRQSAGDPIEPLRT